MLSVPVSGTWIDIPFTLPPNTVDGATPVVTTEDAATAMRAVLAIAAGVDGPEFLPAVTVGTATVSIVFMARFAIAPGMIAHVMTFLAPFWLAYILLMGTTARKRVDEMLSVRFANEDLTDALRVAR